MTTALSPHLVLTDDEMMAAAARAGVQAFPVVLGLRPRHGTETTLASAVDHATDALADRGLIRDGQVAPELVGLLSALQRPDRELALRLVTPDGAARVTVVRNGTRSVAARRVGNEMVLTAIAGDQGLTAAAKALLQQLPASAPAEITPVGAPLDTFAEALTGTHDAAALSDRVRALGAEPRAAMVLGTALASRLAFAEIVYYSLDVDADLISRRPAAVSVFYTKRGRIVAAPSASPSGQLWTTLKAGSDHAIKQAIGQLVELSGDRWEEF